MKKTHINKPCNLLHKLLADTETKIEKIEQYMHDALENATESYENKSEAWQEGENGEEYYARMEEYEIAIDDLNDARSEIEELITTVLDTIENLTY